MSLDSYFDRLENEEFIRGQNAIEGDGISTPPTENAVESYFAEIEKLPTKKRSAKDIFQQSFDNLTNALSSTANGYLDVAGDVAGAINRGVVALPDTPAILQNLAVDLSGADDGFRARTIQGALDESPLAPAFSQRAPEGGVMDEYVLPAVEATAGFGLAAPRIATAGGRVMDDALSWLGVGQGSAANVPAAARSAETAVSPAVQESMSIARQPEVSAERMAEPFDASLAPQEIPPVPNIVDDPLATLVNNRYSAPGFVEMLKGAGRETAQSMVEMLDRARKVEAEPRLGVKLQPRDVLGEEISRRAGVLAGEATNAGKAIGDEAKALKGVDVSADSVLASFLRGLDSNGVTITNDGLDFTGSAFEGLGDEEMLSKIFDRLSRYQSGLADGAQMHLDKQWMSEFANFGPTKDKGISARGQNIVKSARAEIVRALGDASPAYAEANKRYAQVSGPLGEISRILGREINLDDPRAVAEIARQARGLLNNTKQGVNLSQVISDVDDLAADILSRGDKKVLEDFFNAGGSWNPKKGFEVDIPTLSQFSASIDTMFPNLRPTSFGGILASTADRSSEVAGGLLDMASGGTGTMSVLRNVGGKISDAVVDPDKVADAAQRARVANQRRRRDETANAIEGLLERGF